MLQMEPLDTLLPHVSVATAFLVKKVHALYNCLADGRYFGDPQINSRKHECFLPLNLN